MPEQIGKAQQAGSVQSGVGQALSKRGPSLLAGVTALALVAVYGAPRLAASLPQTRSISLYNIHTKETVTVEYKKDGKYVPAAMEQIDWILRDWRQDEKTRMDPELVDLLWEIHTELGSKEPIHIISGYRSRATNDLLRKTSGGQAKQSRHILGKAADVHFPDVPIRRLRYSALIRERGGVGYYPTSAIPFVHVDTDRVRAWPRLPRHELALLFPDGRTRHIPADGKPLTPRDVQIARTEHADLATQIAAYHKLRQAVQAPIQIASADSRLTPRAEPVSPPPPQLVAMATPPSEPTRKTAHSAVKLQPSVEPKLISEPQLASRPVLASRTSDEDRIRLAQLAALASFESVPRIMPASFQRAEPPSQSFAFPLSRGGRDGSGSGSALAAQSDVELATEPPLERFGWGAGWQLDQERQTAALPLSWAVAPEYDDEHPEELSYRPFPIIPYLTETSSPDDPALVRMEHPDVAKTLELLDNAGELPPMRLRPEPQKVQLLWAQQFQGEAVPLASVFAERNAPAGSLAKRPVRLSSR